MFEKVFFLIESESYIDNKPYIGYGIGCYVTGQIIFFEDISINRERVQTLISMCNQLSLSPIHIYDVIQDFLIDA